MNTHLKSLFLVRHAKAESGAHNMADIDRPLHSKGVVEANFVAAEIAKIPVTPDLIISSPAVRAISTALIFQRALKFPLTNLQFNDSLYEISVENLIKLVEQLDDRYRSVMLFGHNPAFSLFSMLLHPSISHMPTGSVVHFELKIKEWRTFSEAATEMKLFLSP